MKVIICNDDDGHFRVAKISDRENTLNVLYGIHNDQYGIICDQYDLDYYEESPSINNISDDEWHSYLKNFEERGSCEIKELL